MVNLELSTSCLSFMLICFGFVFILWKAFFQWLKDHHSNWKFIRTKIFFIFYVQYYKFFKNGNSDYKGSISLKLYLMDQAFHFLFKKKFSNHTIKNAKYLLDFTRESRDGFLEHTMQPINIRNNNNNNNNKIKIERDFIENSKVLWVNKDSLKNGIIISYHGGAYVSGTAESCLPYLIPICENTKMAGLSINYNLAPEYSLPHSINQSYNILKYLCNKMNINNKKICLIGDSAGASLIILLMQKIHQENVKLMPACGITISSWDVPSEGDSYLRNKEKDSLLDQSTGQTWAQMAVGNVNNKGEITNKNAKLNDAKWCYLAKENESKFESFPPLLLSFSEYECVSDDSIGIKERCDKYNIPCEMAMTPQCGLHVLEVLHGYDIPEATKLIEKECQFILKYIEK